MDKENVIKNFLENEIPEHFHTDSPPEFITVYVNGRTVRFNYVHSLSGKKSEFMGKTYHTVYQSTEQNAEGDFPIIEIVTMMGKRNKPVFVEHSLHGCRIFVVRRYKYGNRYIIQ